MSLGTANSPVESRYVNVFPNPWIICVAFFSFFSPIAQNKVKPEAKKNNKKGCMLDLECHKSIFMFVALKEKKKSTGPLTQWWRIRLPMQETWNWSLIWEDSTCHRATKLVCHNYWVCALEPESCNYWAHLLQILKPACLEPMLPNKRSHRNVKPVHPSEREAPTHCN